MQRKGRKILQIYSKAMDYVITSVLCSCVSPGFKLAMQDMLGLGLFEQTYGRYVPKSQIVQFHFSTKGRKETSDLVLHWFHLYSLSAT